MTDRSLAAGHLADSHPPFTHRVDARLLLPVDCVSLRRFGSANDGGYVVPAEAISRASTLLSFGVSMDWSFERAVVAATPGLEVHAYDHTVHGRLFVDQGIRDALNLLWGAVTLNGRTVRSSFHRIRRSIDYFRFFRGSVRHHCRRVWYNDDRGSAPIEKIIADTGPHAPLSIFASIDIEGSEYRIISSIAKQAALFTGLVIEFHDTDICADMFNAQLGQLRESFEVVHVHGNNHGDLSIDGGLPLTLEISFLNKALFDEPPRLYRGPLPRPGLDAPNEPSRADYVLDLEGRARESAG